MPFNFEALKDILVCPQSKAELVLENDRLVSADPDTRLSYEIRDGIPIMLIEEAQTLPSDQWSAIMTKHGRDAKTGKSR
jgi:uncharacterized protein YbaR (Trm112 family)